MLKLALEKCKEFSFRTIRINCDDKNISSKKIIEKMVVKWILKVIKQRMEQVLHI